MPRLAGAAAGAAGCGGCSLRRRRRRLPPAMDARSVCRYRWRTPTRIAAIDASVSVRPEAEDTARPSQPNRRSPVPQMGRCFRPKLARVQVGRPELTEQLKEQPPQSGAKGRRATACRDAAGEDAGVSHPALLRLQTLPPGSFARPALSPPPSFSPSTALHSVA